MVEPLPVSTNRQCFRNFRIGPIFGIRKFTSFARLHKCRQRFVSQFIKKYLNTCIFSYKCYHIVATFSINRSNFAHFLLHVFRRAILTFPFLLSFHALGFLHVSIGQDKRKENAETWSRIWSPKWFTGGCAFWFLILSLIEIRLDCLLLSQTGRSNRPRFDS